MSVTAHQRIFNNSYIFSQFYSRIMTTEAPLKGKLMKHELIIKEINTLIKEYVRSNTPYINEFFRQKMVKNL